MANPLKQLKQLEKLSSNHKLPSEIFVKPWQSLISTMLSARTTDKKTIEVCHVLFKKYKSIESLSKASLTSIMKIVKPVNFYKTKAKNVSNCAKILDSKYNGNPPHDIKLLIELPGVGRKTANVFLQYQGKAAIGVDTHVSYIAQKLKWTKNKKPELIEKDLERLFPRRYWGRINPALVRFGQTYKSRRKQDEILKKLK